MEIGRVAEKIKETIENDPGITKGKLEDIYCRNTIWYNIYRDKGRLKNEIRIEKNSVGVDTYYSRKTEGDVGSEYLNFLMESYRSFISLQDRTKQQEIILDIHSVCREKKIRDEDFIKFLIEYSKKKVKGDIDFSQIQKQFGVEYRDDNIFWMCLGAVALKLVSNVESDKSDSAKFEKYLLELIGNTSSFFKKVIFNHSRDPSERVLALDVLREMIYPKNQELYDLAFRLLTNTNTEKELDFLKPKARGTEFDLFWSRVESLISSYAKINPTDCRKRLYSLLDANLGSEISLSLREVGSEISDSNKYRGVKFTAREQKIKNVIMHLLEITRKQ